jgi:hypothetical protein
MPTLISPPFEPTRIFDNLWLHLDQMEGRPISEHLDGSLRCPRTHSGDFRGNWAVRYSCGAVMTYWSLLAVVTGSS